MKHIYLFILLSGIFPFLTDAQPDRWQQRVDYKMDIDFNVSNHQFTGTQKLIYFNNSPDTLKRLFYHLYFNTFQPGSIMDVRSLNLPDPDGRVRDRISKLQENEIGYQHILSLKQDGIPLQYTIEGTILEVRLNKWIRPKSKTVLEMQFQAQVPVQIRRSGRNNKEGIAYSMSQWYPKLCEYDYQGWHANPYVAREFYGVWGDFDVTIHMDKKYLIAAGGYIQNPNEVGYGYEKTGAKLKLPSGEKLTWHFKAPNVHDFMWAADPEYKHTRLVNDDGIEMNFFYQENDKTKDTWAQLPSIMNHVFKIADKHFGQYPYSYFAFVQGGDGGMEYPMSTLIMGEGTLTGLVGVATHEMMHSWYQGVIGTNESLYAWMDEGFTSYAEDKILAELNTSGSTEDYATNAYTSAYQSYLKLAMSGREEPLSTHADHFNSNYAYSVAAYSKGEVFLHQLEYIIGKQNFEQGLLNYFNTWKFKEPNVNDLIRVFEKASGLELDWYKEYFVNGTKQIDYSIDSVYGDATKSFVRLRKVSPFIMPIDLLVTQDDGTETIEYIPLDLMRGEKKQEWPDKKFNLHPDWTWVYPTYTVALNIPFSYLKRIEIDPSLRLADIHRENGVWAR
ncbi:MAG: M1 family metallopeptidase [Saprospiraceae bacterium]